MRTYTIKVLVTPPNIEIMLGISQFVDTIAFVKSKTRASGVDALNKALGYMQGIAGPFSLISK